MTLDGAAAVVTGAGRGIGRSIAAALAASGAHVGLISRTQTELLQTAAMIRDAGGRCAEYVADVSDSASVEAIISDIEEKLGAIVVLVNNAAIQAPIGPTCQADPPEWMRCIEVNLFGTFVCSRHTLPYMMARRQGHIINVSGGGATSSRANFSAYAASKAAVVRFTETLAIELMESNICVNAISPGAVNTRMLEEILLSGERAGSELVDAQARLHKGGVTPDLAAKLVLFLISPAARGLTGKLISAPYDDWQNWDGRRISELRGSDWLNLRRMDDHTLRPLIGSIRAADVHK